MNSAASTRLRCDPTDYAKKQQEKKDRAKDLREQRSKGVFSDDHTFAPKTNPKSKTPESTSREEQEAHCAPPASNSFDDMPIHPAKRVPPPSNNVRSNNNNHDDDEARASAGGDPDALDNLSRKFPKKPPVKQPESRSPTPLEPEHDTLFREVKRATGRELDDIPIRRASSNAGAAKHTGPCLRNSSCGCPQCAGGASVAAVSSRPDPPVRQRQMKTPAVTADDPYACQSNTSRSYNGAQHEMESSLALLKSKMSRRKSRSAPTNQASLFVEKSSSTAHPARNPPSVPARAQPVPVAAAPRRAAPAPSPAADPPQKTRKAAPASRSRQQQEEPQDDYSPPVPSGYTMPDDMDEFADQSEEMEECDNCHRRFNLTSFPKHRKICEKVFSAQRKVFNMAAKRLEGTEAEKIAKKASSSSGKGGANSKKGAVAADEKPLNKKPDWKSKSSAFRDAMKVSRDVTVALKEGRELPPMKPSAPDPSLIQCEFCSRRFNDKAAERHITFCREKTQRDGMAKGPPKKAPAPAAKPTRAPAKKK
ncbi:hypothetical protein Gpo141_00001652 [Globisporangium polare]